MRAYGPRLKYNYESKIGLRCYEYINQALEDKIEGGGLGCGKAIVCSKLSFFAKLYYYFY